MKIHLISDIHTELADVEYGTPPNADLIILAGDIGEGVDGLIWASNAFPEVPIIYVAGNHEYYGQDFSVINSMRIIAKKLDIYFLENDEVVIGGVRFLGCTLWTDYNKFNVKVVDGAWLTMNDYKTISCKSWWQIEENKQRAFELLGSFFSKNSYYKSMFSPITAYMAHQDSIAWLENKLSEEFEGKTVVVTHHAPSFQSAYNQFKNAALLYCYCSDLEDFIKNNEIDFWLHGHLHQPANYKIGNTEIVSNSKGYPTRIAKPKIYDGEHCKDFNAKLLIEI